MKTLQDFYLDLLAAWGQPPLDTDAVLEILTEMRIDAVKMV